MPDHRDDRPHDTDPAIADTQTTGSGGPAAAISSATLTRAPRSIRAGDVLGRYEIGDELGEGGMATVFRARDKELRRDVAVKVLFPHLAKRPDVVRRFQREARAAAGLEHPNILRIYDVGGGGEPSSILPRAGSSAPIDRRDLAPGSSTDGSSGPGSVDPRAAGEIDPPYIVMELIRGRTLLQEIEARGPILAEVAACIGALLADALSAAHAAGIIHRDIKPSNVLIAQGGRLLLADFGVARLETEDSLVTRTGALLGTPAYMSPEQASGDTATAKSDLYSLGATLYQLSTGLLPYTGSPAKVMSQIASGSLVAPVRRRAAVGPELSRAIETMMETEADARPASATVIAAALRQIANAGGLGDATEELSAFFDDPDAFLRSRTPAVVAAILVAAERAITDQKLPRAIALVDCASALAPDDPAVNALVEKVTEGGRSNDRRRMFMLATAGVVLAGGATVGVLAVMNRDPAVASIDATSLTGPPLAAPPDVALASEDAPLALDGPTRLSSTLPDAGPIDVVPVDGANPRDAAVATQRRADAAVASIDRAGSGGAAGGGPGSEVASIDGAPPVPIDGAVLAIPDASLEPGSILVINDTWCDLSIDQIDQGQLTNQKLVRVSPGRHVVTCAQGAGTGLRWSETVEVAPGKTSTLRKTMIVPVAVRIAVGDKVIIDNQLHAPLGTQVELKPGRHQVVVVVDGTPGKVHYVDIPRLVACQLRVVDGKLVCDR